MKKHVAKNPTHKLATRDGKPAGWVGHCSCGWPTPRRWPTPADAYRSTVVDHIALVTRTKARAW